jgi:hypothetical protein
VFAVLAGLLFAIPWAGWIATGDPGADPTLWHELHALAGIGFALSLLELRRRYRGWFTMTGRIALSVAVASAVGFVVANAGELLGASGFLGELYGISLLALSAALIAVSVTTPTLPRPLPLLLIATGVALPAILALNLVLPLSGAAFGPTLAGAALMGYGLLWAALGFVQLSRTP